MTDNLFDLDIEVEEPDPAERKLRQKKEYHAAYGRKKTRREQMAGEEGIFDLDLGADRPSLDELYGTMDDVRELIGTNGLKSVSLFSGSGASETGFAMAGFENLLAVEFVKSARETIAANYPSYIIEPELVTKIAEEWLAEQTTTAMDVVRTGRRRIKGVVHEPIIDWAATLEMLALRYKENGDERIVEELPKFRYDVTKRALERARAEQDPLRKATPIWGDDIRFFDATAFMEIIGIEPGELDCLEGSPPCKSFSMSGVRESGWGEVVKYSDERNQRTDDLFYEYVRVLRDFKPKTFIAENVNGLVVGEAATKMLYPLMKEFDTLGYRVDYRVVQASDHGVPQSRPRVFLIGVRKDLVDNRTGRYATPAFPKPFDHSYTVGDVLETVGDSNSKDELEFADITGTEAGKTWGVLSPGQAPENKQYQITRCHPNMPSPTITQTDAANPASAGPLHPFECRKFTIKEYRYLFGFPVDYVLTGTLNQQGERLGRAVAPFLMRQLATSIADTLMHAERDTELEEA